MSSSLLARLRPILVAGVCLAIPAPLHPAQNAGPSPRRTCSPSCGWPIRRSRPTGRVAFLRVSVDRQKDQYETAIWIADSDGRELPRRVTAGPRDTAPRWSPDGTRLAFVRAAESDGRAAAADLRDADERWRRTRRPTSRAAPETRPGRLTAAPSPSRRPHVRRSSLPTRAPRRIRTNARVTCASSRKRDTGRTACREAATWTAIARPHIWTVALGDVASKPAVPKAPDLGEFGAANHQWSPTAGRSSSPRTDGRSLLPGDSISTPCRLMAASRAGRPVSTATSGPLRSPAMASASRSSAARMPSRSAPCDQSDLFVVETSGGTPRNLTASA